MTKLDFLEKRALFCALCLGFGLMGACSDDDNGDGVTGGTGGRAGAAGAAGSGGSAGSAGSGGTSGSGGSAGGGGMAGAAGAGGSSAGMGGAAGAGGADGLEDAGVDSGVVIEVDAGDGEEEELVTFADVHPVLVENCGGCHGGGELPAFAQADVDDAFAVTQAIGADGDPNYERIIFRAIEFGIAGDPMPPPCVDEELGGLECLSEEEAALIQTWVADGAQR